MNPPFRKAFARPWRTASCSLVFNALLCVAFDQWPIASALGQAATVRWVRDAGGVDDDCGLAIATDASGDSCVLGYFNVGKHGAPCLFHVGFGLQQPAERTLTKAAALAWMLPVIAM